MRTRAEKQLTNEGSPGGLTILVDEPLTGLAGVRRGEHHVTEPHMSGINILEKVNITEQMHFMDSPSPRSLSPFRLFNINVSKLLAVKLSSFVLRV